MSESFRRADGLRQWKNGARASFPHIEDLIWRKHGCAEVPAPYGRGGELHVPGRSHA
ncbi:hypothetical protein MYX76_16780 [Desulfobacterota bacterium AH_259_B03_O07]|nr:hypothetical protein [Desulfobacterota bacterium AH_259_B03_O07]